METLGAQAFSTFGIAALVIFVAAYFLVFLEEKIHLRKSKPVMVAAGFMWAIVAIVARKAGQEKAIEETLQHVLVEYAGLLLFLLAAMSFINVMIERHVFEALRHRLVAARLSSRGLFWVTGGCAFLLSPLADNLTTALVMGTVVLSTFGAQKKAVVPALVNIVVAANAGGAFSPFGDITTLMIWQKGVVAFGDFFVLFVPSLVNWVLPALAMSFFLPRFKPEEAGAAVRMKDGAIPVIGLFLLTLLITVSGHHLLHLPPFLGMMTGLGLLNLYGYVLRKTETRRAILKPFDMFDIFAKIEWDTLLFFYGIMLCVGALGALGHLQALSVLLYQDLGATKANIAIGLLSAVIDNIPLTYAVLSMDPVLSQGQWLLLTLTAGVGGSLLSIGSAAGVALMGIGRGLYGFSSHLRWIWAVALGYAASIAAHCVLNAALF